MKGVCKGVTGESKKIKGQLRKLEDKDEFIHCYVATLVDLSIGN